MGLFDKLSGSLQKVFRDMRGYGKLSEQNIADALREVRMALLEADVNFLVVKDFIAKVREKCVGLEVLDSVSPGQQFIKFVHDELVALLGGKQKDFDLTGPRPARIMMIGLHGSGKTTTSGKLAAFWKKQHKRVALVACDIRRPAAVDQLEILGKQVGADVVIKPQPGESVPMIGKRAMQEFQSLESHVAIFDTGGRFQIDAELVQELKELREAINPNNVILVLDAAIGQESVNVAQTFHKELGLTGLILTKLDGDARGGAALSVQYVTGVPVLMTGVGEQMDKLEPFYPERMASRILGMGDIVSFVEKAQQAFDDKDAEAMEEQMMKDDITLDDFLKQMRFMKKLGPLENILEMMPGAGRIPEHLKSQIGADSGRQMKTIEAIIHSMTPKERRKPDVINGSRRRRIAAGSGTRVQDVNELLKKFDDAKKMAKRMKQQRKKMMRFGR